MSSADGCGVGARCGGLADDPEHPPFDGRSLPRAEIDRLQAHGADLIPGYVLGIRAFWQQRRRPSGVGGARRAGRGANRSRRA